MFPEATSGHAEQRIPSLGPSMPQNALQNRFTFAFALCVRSQGPWCDLEVASGVPETALKLAISGSTDGRIQILKLWRMRAHCTHLVLSCGSFMAGALPIHSVIFTASFKSFLKTHLFSEAFDHSLVFIPNQNEA